MPESLRVGIDGRGAVEVAAGRGRLVRELLMALARRDDDVRYLCYARRRWEEPLDQRFAWRLIDSADPWWHVQTARTASRECDVFLSSNSYLTAALLRIPAVPVVYDLIPFDPALKPNLRSTVIERLTLGTAVRRSRGFVAISQATADDLVRRFPAAAGRVTVAPLGVARHLADPPSAAELAALPEPGFVLVVGTLEPRKNLPRLVAAYARLDEQLQRHHPLVVVGALGWQTGDTVAALDSLGERAKRLGYVSDGALAELYRRCALFCFPSLGEGFGLPVLEAMAAGAAVLTSDVPALREVGGEAVAYADPRDVDAIAGALRALLDSPERRDELAALGPDRARSFSWEHTAERTLAALVEASGRG